MKERIKRFYHDHKTKVVVGASGVALVMLVAAKKRNDQTITGVDFWTNADGSRMIQVGTKNGENHYFHSNQD